jgi:hypothetical protein
VADQGDARANGGAVSRESRTVFTIVPLAPGIEAWLQQLHDVMWQNNRPGAPAGLPFEMQRAVVAALMEKRWVTSPIRPRCLRIFSKA